ncbi:TKL protein Kinase [Phytophthora palmivora]|uniref:TKL protein Kinase n=1 Tax=Phytophthora palmivora TaxID=4796 RepID=A0A2P4Y890_9STRA|nr:TKL protein Kinase [Phytophthora palmivora]
MGRWQQWVDPRVATGDRWHSHRVGFVRTSVILGDHLVSALRELARTSSDDIAVARTGQFLNKMLRGFERERRLLLRFADSARVILLLQRTIESVLGMQDILESEIREIWDRNLESERKEWIQEIENVLGDNEKMKVEMGDDDQQVQMLNMLKHQLDQFSHVLTSRELDVVSEVFDTIARRGNVMVGNLPHWFATSELEWFRAKTTVVAEGEEACERQAAIWAKLHHPNIRKFFGACHVGSPFVIHEACTRALGKATQTWGYILGCVLGLQYVHDCGLVHERLTVGHLLFSQATQKGILSGMGLVRRCEISSQDSCELNQGPSVSSDILAMGLAIFEILVKDRSPDTISSRGIGFDHLPVIRPNFIKRIEWKLLEGMCAPDPVERTGMAEAVHQINVLARRIAPPVSKSSVNASVAIENVSEYEIQTLGMTLEATLEEIELLCDERDSDSIGNVNRSVYDRLMDIYLQFVVSPNPISMALVESFSLVVLRFFDMLDQSTLGGVSAVPGICVSGTVAGKNYSFHHDIDALLRAFDLDNTAPIHSWQTAWRESRQREGDTLKSYLENPKSLLSQISNDVDRAEVVTLMQFAATTQVGTFSDHLASVGDGNEELPLWFIPPYQVQLGTHIADGSFGAVYEGEWLDTDVVVKQVLLDPTDKENWEQFRREAELWFTLNHPNIIELYGACHQGRPFFVCEPASHGTLASYLKGKDRRTIWFAIGDAALGLQYLHDHNIIHGDIKGNNILVCDSLDGLPTAKLADFGLSIVTTHTTTSASNDNGVLGAFRWKAPECLLGARATFASDIYSLGMCIIEAITNQYPWGNTLPDSVVIRNVTEMRSLPPRPECMSDDEWQLVSWMCRFEPHRRVPIGAVINWAFNLAA